MADPNWEDFLLAEQPQWAYFSSTPFTTSTQQGFAPAQQNYWRGQYGDVWSRYLGSLGAETRGGDVVGGFTDFLEDMPWTQMYYQNTTPGQRGSQSRYNPATRYVY
jgi:hypothetical protein